MKFFTALLLMGISISGYSQTILLQAGDFVKGELISQTSQEVDLIIKFSDKTDRTLLQNVAGTRQFMFKSEQSGEAQFIAQSGDKTLTTEKYHLSILQHIPLSAQKPLQTHYKSPMIAALVKNQTAENLEKFWQNITAQGTPLIEPVAESNKSIVTFLWRGAKQNVWLWGAPTADHEPLDRLPDSDIWFKSYVLPNDSFLSYGFAPDVPILPVSKQEQRRAILSTLQADPLNHFPYPAHMKNTQDKFSYYSSLRLKNAPISPFLGVQNVAKGKLTYHQFHSNILQNTRRIVIYTSANFVAHNEKQIVLFILDGTDYLDKAPTPQILDKMLAAEKIPPTVAVFIDNPSNETRAAELPPNPQFATMLAEELQPWITQQLNLKTSPNRTALMGSSYGGLAAAYVVNQYPEIFGNAIIMSGSFWWQQPNTPSEERHTIAKLYASQPQKPLRFFISAGRYENANEMNILDSSRHLKDVLIAKEYNVIYKEYASDHSYFAWQTILSDGLLALFGK